MTPYVMTLHVTTKGKHAQIKTIKLPPFQKVKIVVEIKNNICIDPWQYINY
jgi:hypothetical protein